MKAALLQGFRDYGPREMTARLAMLRIMEGAFRSFGYGPLSTPALEYAEILTGKYGEEGDKLLYRFRDNGGRDVALRYDLTVPLARYVGTSPELKMPFRRYAIAPVWRAERPQKGRFREFMQCDADLLGAETADADAEILLLGARLLGDLGLRDFQLRLSHRGVLDGLMECLVVPQERRLGVIRHLDKAHKVGREEILTGFSDQGLDNAQVAGLERFLALDGSSQDRLRGIAALTGGAAAGADACRRLEEILTLLDAAGVGNRVLLDPTIARGLDYYTGAVYETFLLDNPEYGSVMSGGRYDGLLGATAGRDLPAVGISVGLDRLFAALLDRGQVTLPRGVSSVLVVNFQETAALGFRLAERARRLAPDAGVELYPAPARLKKQLQYADEQGIGLLLLPGPAEVARGVIIARNMVTGGQVEVPLEDDAQLGTVLRS
ncbi:MAG: histidine--tRNA ligase [Deltaproteobacteria bacterium]|nr:histidine--tRNA ligase [Deltaproteobacteria bacterium]